MTHRILGAAFAVGLALNATPVFAADMAEMDMGKDATRVLRIVPGLCPATIDAFKAWAVSFEKHGAFAVPVAPASLSATCENPGPTVPAGQSMGYDDRSSARASALAVCNDARPVGFGPCVVVAHAHDR